MSWGGLNPALTVWRNAINARFPDRGLASDGAVADEFHSPSSRHQPDADGTVDAFDCDVNFLGSNRPQGTPEERRICEALKLDFENDPHGRSILWIHQRVIANATVDDWREREYTGDSPHDKHIHFQSRQNREHDDRPWPMPRTDALLRETEDLPMKQDDFDKLMTSWARSRAGRDALHEVMRSIVEKDPATGEENLRWGGAIRTQNQRRDQQTTTITRRIDARADEILAAVRDNG
ncbi:hypothetical protein [Spirilliplanes yamanashiensis]|nr:hypothetical protein [Spirilliplanes yamanashiensis]MDP9817826.1 hypothetical protein [Spirilliplanes yamanashiensis]